MRVVLDTDVVVAGTRSRRGASRLLLRAALRQRFTLLVSVPLFVEYEAVLSRPAHLSAAAMQIQDAHALLDAIAMVAEPVHVNYLWRPLSSDPDNEMVLEAALNGRADMLVSFNTRDLATAAARFHITCRRPGEALGLLGGGYDA